MQQPELLAQNTIVRGNNAEYRIMGLIGRGGMGAVYRAQRTADSAIWALKEMRAPANVPAEEAQENRRLFEQEAELLRTLAHPNLPIVAETFEHAGRPVMVMEYVPGQSLEERMQEANAPLLEQQALGFAIQLTRVLNYLHTRTPPIIYRDLKPSNVIVTPEGVLKLVDFGVARTYKARKSKDTVAMGSAGYAPPEQYGKGQTDARSDIYALGATLLHMLTNMPPIPLQTPTLGSINKMNPSVDSQTEHVIMQAMALDQNKRFQSMAALEQALLRCLDGPFVDPTARAMPPPPVRVPIITPPPQPLPQPVVVAPQPVPVVARPAPQPPVRVPQPVAPADGVACESCGRVNKREAKFCAGCGAPLGVPPVARIKLTSPRGTWEQKVERMPMRIGRRDPRQKHFPEIDLAEHDRGIASRNHAQIGRDGSFYTITDLGSTNGTFLNGKPLQPNRPARLRSGDRVKVGEVEMEFRGS